MGSKCVRLLPVNTVFAFPHLETLRKKSPEHFILGTEARLRRVVWAGELAVLRAEGRGSGLAGSGVEHSVESFPGD